jgi:hypothetical protein
MPDALDYTSAIIVLEKIVKLLEDIKKNTATPDAKK